MSSTATSSSAVTPEPSRLSRIIRNALSILGSDIANRASSFALFILVARLLGERAFGQITLAQSTFFFLGYSLAGLGLRWFLARELAKTPEKTSRYLANGIVLMLITSGIAYLAITLLSLLAGYPVDTRNAILLMALTIFPYTMITVLEGTFIGHEKMHLIVLVNAPLNIANIVLTVVALQMGGDLMVVILIQVIAYTLIALIEWILMLRYVAKPAFGFDLSELGQLVRGTASFYGVDAVVAVGGTIQLFLISLVVTEDRVGVFNSAYQILNPVIIVAGSFINSMLPVLTRQVAPGLYQASLSTRRLMELLFWMVVPTIVGAFFVANDILVFIYERESFAEAGNYLRVASFTLFGYVIVRILGTLLYATNNESANLRLVLINNVVYLTLSLIFIPPFGPVGALIASMLMTLIDIALHSEAVWRRLHLFFNPLPLLWRSLLAASVMAVALYLLPADLHVLVRVAIGAGVYGAALLIVLRLTIGGIGKIREYYLSRGGEAVPTTLKPLAEGD